jgi:hypothetical protein
MLPARTLVKSLLTCLALVVLFISGAAQAELSDEQIKAKIIQQSIAAYPGTCACPYQVTRNGSRCGRRSAYSKPGGFAPLCYPQDVTPELVERYKRR